MQEKELLFYEGFKTGKFPEGFQERKVKVKVKVRKFSASMENFVEIDKPLVGDNLVY